MDSEASNRAGNEDRRLVASGHDDPLGVHVITEFLFCPRAGVIAHESEESDRGQDTRPIRLGYLPRYDQARIAEAIGRITMYLIGGVVGGLLSIGLCGILTLTVSPTFLIGCWLLLLVLVVGVATGCWALVVLTHRHSRAAGAKPKEPKFDGDNPTAADWWGLIAAGFELRIWPDPLEDSEWKLAGRPWRVLVRGETYVPVFLRNSDNRKLHKQHFARMAAYCQLLQRQAGGESPFGVILYAKTQDAVAIPNSGAAHRALADGAAGMRRLLPNLKGGLQPEPPADESICRGCPNGAMQVYQEIPQRSEDQPPFLEKSRGKHYHCVCGDRFRATPPHRSAIALGIK